VTARSESASGLAGGYVRRARRSVSDEIALAAPSLLTIGTFMSRLEPGQTTASRQTTRKISYVVLGGSRFIDDRRYGDRLGTRRRLRRAGLAPHEHRAGEIRLLLAQPTARFGKARFSRQGAPYELTSICSPCGPAATKNHPLFDAGLREKLRSPDGALHRAALSLCEVRHQHVRICFAKTVLKCRQFMIQSAEESHRHEYESPLRSDEDHGHNDLRALCAVGGSAATSSRRNCCGQRALLDSCGDWRTTTVASHLAHNRRSSHMVVHTAAAAFSSTASTHRQANSCRRARTAISGMFRSPRAHRKYFTNDDPPSAAGRELIEPCETLPALLRQHLSAYVEPLAELTQSRRKHMTSEEISSRRR